MREWKLLYLNIIISEDMVQVIIFILGYQGSGKSSIIRALTGSRQIELRDLRSIDGRLLPVLVNLRSPQERSCEDHPPDSFPESIEKLVGVSRDVWDVLVSALQYTPQESECPYEEYVTTSIEKGFEVKIAFIERKQNRSSLSKREIYEVQDFCDRVDIPIVLVDAAMDPSVEANRIRDTFYPNLLD